MDEPGSQPPESEDQDLDLGEPLEMLTEGHQDLNDDFMASVRRSIQRRTLAADLTSQILLIPVLVFFEFLSVLFSLAEGLKARKEDD